MDTITRELRSQVCLNKTTPPIAAGTGDSVTFYADFTNQANPDVPPVYRAVTFDGSRISERDIAGRSNHAKPPTFTYDTGTATNRVLIDGVRRYRAPAASTDTPIFQYYAYDAANPPQPTVLLPTPLSADDRARVARIDINYVALPGSGTASFSLPVQDQVQVRQADPNTYDPDRPVAPTPEC
jgi:hypothetical protein